MKYLLVIFTFAITFLLAATVVLADENPSPSPQVNVNVNQAGTNNNSNVNTNNNSNENKIDIDIKNKQTQTQTVNLQTAAIPRTLPATGASPIALASMIASIPLGLYLRRYKPKVIS